MKANKKSRKVNKFIYGAPRMLSIILILFLALFSLDIFDSCNNFLNCSLGLLIHNLPSLILLVILIISWKYEIAGAISFILAGLLYIATVAIRQGVILAISWGIIIAGPVFLIGILFLINWKKKKQR